MTRDLLRAGDAYINMVAGEVFIALDDATHDSRKPITFAVLTVRKASRSAAIISRDGDWLYHEGWKYNIDCKRIS